LVGAVSYRARELGAEPFVLGLVGAAGDGVYMASCLLLGGLSERYGRRFMIRVAVAAFVAAGLFAYAATSVAALTAALVLQRVAAAVFWPTIQGRLADQSVDLGRDAGLFNLSWSAGKTCGYLTNGLVFGPLGLPTAAAFLWSGAASLLVGLLAPPDRTTKAVREDGGRVAPEEAALASRRIGVALLGNFAGCTAFTVLTGQASALMASRGLGKDFGSLLTACFTLAQIASFLFAFRRHDLVGRGRTLLAATLLVIGGAAGFALAREGAVLALAAGLAGFGAGLAYAQAMLLSLRLPAAATKGAGRHEAVIGLANASTAPLAGYVATSTGRPDDAVWTAAAVTATVVVVQSAKLGAERRARRRAAAGLR
jgi:MFS family permease